MRLTALAVPLALLFAVAGVSADEPAKPTKTNPFRDGSGVATDPTDKAPAASDVKEAPKRLLPNDAGVGRFVPDVAFTDLTGKEGKLSDFKASKLLVVAFTNTTCPISKKYTPTLQRLEKEYADKGVAFLFVNPTKTDKPDAKTFAGRYVHDTDGTLTAALGATSTAEVFVLDAARTVRFRGAIDDQYGLGYALDKPRANYLTISVTDLLAGKEPVVLATTAPGCELTPAAAKTPVVPLTYHARVERIIQNNCVECHRTGGVGPFALDTYDALVAQKGMVRKTVEKGTMPPWFAAPPEKGKHSPFVNDRTLTESDRKDLVAWLTGDLKKGDAADAPLARTFETGWLIGKPDVVYQIPKPIAVKAQGTMSYQNVTVDTEYDEDKWVQALEVQPTAREVVHHVLVFALPKGARGGAADVISFFAAYVPGNNKLIYPEGYAKKLPKGSTLRFQIHYTPNGKATSDQTKLALVFAKEKPRHEVQVTAVVNPVFSIPAGADNHKIAATIPSVPVDARVLAMFPHAHLRGKAARYELKTPDGKTQTLLDVPHYDFNWQLEYRFANPVSVPKGSTLVYTAWYDNSTKNPANPDPTKSVKWGDQTYDEMHLGYVEYVVDSGSGNISPLGNFGSVDVSDVKFPKAGVDIPDQGKALFGRYDKNKDGKLDESEFEALPAPIKRIVLEYVKRLMP